MGTALKRIELPIPHRGMNVDTSPSQIGPEYCRYSRNMILSEPGQMRPRTGWKRVVGYGDVYSTNTQGNNGVNGVAAYPTYDGTAAEVLVNIVEGSPGSDSEYFVGYNENQQAPGTTRLRVVSIPATGSATVAAATTRVSDRCQVVGPTVFYDKVLYGVNFPEAGLSDVFMWAGKNIADVTTGGVTISNGSTSGTFSSAPAASQTGKFLTVTGGATGPLAGYLYRYRIDTHTAASASFTLSEPYGLGESTTNVPNAVGASTTIEVYSADTLVNTNSTVGGAGCVGLYRERLFVGRGFDVNGDIWSGNRVQWSKPGYPQKVTGTDYFLLPDNELIMGMANVPNGLLIFQPTKTWLLTGYDEDSFTVTALSRQIGCIHGGTICYAGDRVYWASEQGIFMSNGGEPVPVSHPSPGVGIKGDYLELVAADDGTRSLSKTRWCNMETVGDYLVGSFVPRKTSHDVPDAFMCDLRTGAWGRWGNSGQAQDYYQPWAYFNTAKRSFAVTPWQIMDITTCFTNEELPDPVYHQYDEDYTSAPASTTTTIAAELQYADFRLGQDTVRLRGIHVEHNCHYYNATSSPRVAWALTLDNDAEIDESATAVGDIDARYIGNTGAPEFQKYYVTKFEDTDVSRDAAVVRVKLTKTASTNSAKLFRVYLLTDPQATAVGRVDNPTL